LPGGGAPPITRPLRLSSRHAGHHLAGPMAAGLVGSRRVRRHPHHRRRSAPRAASPTVPALLGPGPHHKRRHDSSITGSRRRRKRATCCTRRATCCLRCACGPIARDNSGSVCAGSVMADAALNRRQPIRVATGVAFTQVGSIGIGEMIVPRYQVCFPMGCLSQRCWHKGAQPTSLNCNRTTVTLPGRQQCSLLMLNPPREKWRSPQRCTSARWIRS